MIKTVHLFYVMAALWLLCALQTVLPGALRAIGDCLASYRARPETLTILLGGVVIFAALATLNSCERTRREVKRQTRS